MSLLLDALKKAADDKKKTSQGETTDDFSLDKKPLVSNVTDNTATDELTLEPIKPGFADTENSSAAEIKTDAHVSVNSEHSENTSQPSQKSESAKAAATSTKVASYTVSDEALSMLIDKTNRDAKQSKRRILISVALISLLTLVTGGFYYYTETQAEISILERKHQISMQAMRSKTSNGNFPQESKIIHNLVGESDLTDKVEYAKKQIANKKNTQQKKPRQAAPVKNNKQKVAASNVTFQKTNKRDSVADNLEQAWLAYGDEQYPQAKKIYSKVLAAEKNNRDALLGLGAIAVIEKNNIKARRIYLMLLEINPRDGIAIAALTNLRNSEQATKADEVYLLNMLQKTPADAYLNFALGNVYAQQNKWKPAQEAYFNAWQADAENADYLFNLAVSMDQIGKQKQALNFYQNSLAKAKGKQVSFSRAAVQKRIAELSGL